MKLATQKTCFRLLAALLLLTYGALAPGGELLHHTVHILTRTADDSAFAQRDLSAPGVDTNATPTCDFRLVLSHVLQDRLSPQKPQTLPTVAIVVSALVTAQETVDVYAPSWSIHIRGPPTA